MDETLALPYFDGCEVRVHDLGPQDAPTEAARQAWAAFLELTPEDRLRDSIHLFNYYRDFHWAVGGEDWLDAEMGVPEDPEAIWAHIHPRNVTLVTQNPESDVWYVSLEADCDWDIEHGVQMVWENGARLTKVGEYDGHVTNVHAFADESLAGVVYSASNPDFTTRLDTLPSDAE